jgi:hypothetical protein
MRFVPRKAHRYRKSVARERSGKHTSTTMGSCVFRDREEITEKKNGEELNEIKGTEVVEMEECRG